MKRRLKFAAIGLAAAGAAAQLVQPHFENPPVDPERSLLSDPHTDKRVAEILRRACTDCHSHETKWPWYSRISPVSWMIARHVNQGRAKLNFSRWSAAAAPERYAVARSGKKSAISRAADSWASEP